MTGPAVRDRRDLRDRPFRAEHQVAQNERMERAAKMPTDLRGLLVWFELEWRMESPDALHSSTVWTDHVTVTEARAGIKPVGSSETGALAYADDFRRRMENAPSEVDSKFPDETGRKPYIRPIAAALSRMGMNGKPLTARILMAIGNAGFEWCGVATRAGWPLEMFELWLKEALILLWRDYREWTRAD